VADVVELRVVDGTSHVFYCFFVHVRHVHKIGVLVERFGRRLGADLAPRQFLSVQHHRVAQCPHHVARLVHASGLLIDQLQKALGQQVHLIGERGHRLRRVLLALSEVGPFDVQVGRGIHVDVLAVLGHVLQVVHVASELCSHLVHACVVAV